jgi:release factor glutamine methyltransferase
VTPNPSTWRATRAEVAKRLAVAGIVTAEAEARFLVEEVSGYGAADWPGIADETPSARACARLGPMVERRVGGEPLQYVLGSWSFRGLDLMVDRRVLIPRAETEQVVEVALEEAERRGMRRVRRRHLTLVDVDPAGAVADIGTGSGAIALALDA